MQRVKELDSIRGLAAITIMVYHLWLNEVGKLGLAVNLFFIISGYLITSIIVRNAVNDRFLVMFYARRCLRIWPIYYLTLALLVLISPWLPTPGNLEDLPYYLTYTQEIAHTWLGREPTFPLAFRHTWTLAIEEQFYLLWPALVFFVGRRGIPLLTLILLVAATAARAQNFNYFILITQCDGLALGGLLAYLIVEEDRTRIMSPISRLRLTGPSCAVAGLLIGILLILRGMPARRPELISPSTTKSLELLVANLLLFTMTALVVKSAGNPRLRWLRDPRLVYLGTISYGLYLYHHFVFKIWENYALFYGWKPSLLADLVQFGASVAIAAVSWQFFERPILALKDRFGYQVDAARERDVTGTVNELGGVKTG